MGNILPISDIVNVVITVSPGATVRAGFNLGLIIGTSTIISGITRVLTYASMTEMTNDGWVGDEPEYLAAQLYFAQSAKPKRVAIGRWDDTGTETAAQAVAACRAINNEWYSCLVTDADKADVLAVAAVIEAAIPASVQFFTTKDSDAKAGTSGNVFETLKSAGYRRTLGQWSSVDYAAAAIMGYAMGANTGLENSAFTLMFKGETGVTTEPLTSTELGHIKTDNGNAYVNLGLTYDIFETGTMADGTPFDEVLNLDVLANDIQIAVMDALVNAPKIPQTDEGVELLKGVIIQACERARTIGFLAPGIWTAATILQLVTGDTLSTGYMVQAETIASQSSADVAARKAPPIYAAVKLAGAIQSVLINIVVNE
jgi:hypothetical protein